MFSKLQTILSAALVSGLALAAAIPSASASDGGNDGGFMTITNPDRTSTTGHFFGGGLRLDITRDAEGTPTRVTPKFPPKVKPIKAKKAKPARAPRPRSRPFASAFDPDTGTRTTSIGVAPGLRAVITAPANGQPSLSWSR